MPRLTVHAEARLRAKSQLTLPEPIVETAGVTEGDRFLVEIVPDDPDTIRLHRIRSSYAGSLRDVFGDPVAYLEGERATWESRG
jgi:bifunctional DNA-binding transcriptional regulator/antitoxin component of YhaV-PrlF toxin-antitoxin module